MDNRNRNSNRFRKTPRKPANDGYNNRSDSPQFLNNFGSQQAMYDYNALGNCFAMMNLNDAKYLSAQHSQLYPQSPFTDIANLREYGNSQSSLRNTRKSSVVPSDSESSRRTFSEESNQNWPMNRPFSSSAYDRPMRRRENIDEFCPKPSRSTSSMSSRITNSSKTVSPILPSWALDSHGVLRNNVPFIKVLESGDLVKFAMDKSGCQYLQNVMASDISQHSRDMVFEQVIGKRDVFMKLSHNMFGNFFVQQVIQLSYKTRDKNYEIRQENIKEYIGSKMYDLCVDKSACRVVQFALETLDLPMAISLVQRLPKDYRLINICLDQNSNHVIQKIASVIPLRNWEFIIDFVAYGPNLRKICSDKYGCRVVQTIIEKLTHDSMNQDLTIAAQSLREFALQRLMTSIIDRCSELVVNEYANYIIQHILSCDDMALYRESIIEKCLMRNLLSLSQEKFASHVVEKAFLHAPLGLLAEMMDEIFDGYVPHPETGKDALDIMMFHQFGNYVVQCMLTICCESCSGTRNTNEGGYEHMQSFREWLKKLQNRISKERHRLTRFSSGKKMIETLHSLRLNTELYGLREGMESGASYHGFSSTSDDESKDEDVASVFLEARNVGDLLLFEDEEPSSHPRH